jgi:integrase
MSPYRRWLDHVDRDADAREHERQRQTGDTATHDQHARPVHAARPCVTQVAGPGKRDREPSAHAREGREAEGVRRDASRDRSWSDVARPQRQASAAARAGSIRKLITCLAAILDEAVKYGYIERNPARGRRMRVKVPKPTRTFLEMDELVAVTDAAGAQDVLLVHVARSRVADPSSSAAKVAELLGQGKRTSEIARELGLAKSTVGWHIKRLGVEGPREYAGRRAVVATLGGAGLRASELCDARLRDVRLHDPAGAACGSSTQRPRQGSARCRSAQTWWRSSSPIWIASGVPDCPLIPTPSCSPTAAAGA